MEKNILMIYQRHREETAIEVQKVLTQYGCFIKTRLGIHDGPPMSCSPTGLIILEMVGEKDKITECREKLQKVPDITVELVHLALAE